MPLLPMFPLGSAMLPGQQIPLHVFEPRYQELVRDCLASPDGPRFGVVLIARGHEVGGGDVRHDVGTIARIESHAAVGDGRYELFCRTEDRIKVSKWLPDNPYPIAEVDLWPDENNGTQTADYEFPALVERLEFLYGLLRRLATATDNVPPDVPVVSGFRGELGARLYEIATYIPMGDADRLEILAAAGADERTRVVSEAIENAIEMVQFRLM
ncbi:LON peptidase substrate-binding domain-containing protein [Rhodococcus tibetensis]|uniref:LON peptidase substrate-binding domain-containing protein n=1 Tax=Rhodococcus tibetensis TaxID=2965064 RepID=A0ABT1QJX6_9NOCA|nr:LON peptidase substrate-binding domain-containing protein [Rhodococcus sp. FXJ9.536]MCQ4122599.1 LON peptidase substrate-binding domain-containing protein [Rhodococcus sp. FXJ9.536]